MADNPYQSPTAADLSPPAPPPPSVPRPLGVAMLAVLHVLIGGLMLSNQAYRLLHLDVISTEAQYFGIFLWVFFLEPTLLGLVLAASGVGAWRGWTWGWWLAAWYHAYGALDSARAIAFAMLSTDPDWPTEMAIARYAVFASVASLVLAYLFRRNVLAFFRLAHLGRPMALAVLAAACIGFAVLRIAFDALMW